MRITLDSESNQRHTEKREAIVTAVYSIAPYTGDVEAIADTLAGKAVEEPRLCGSQTAAPIARRQTAARHPGRAKTRPLTDWSPPLASATERISSITSRRSPMVPKLCSSGFEPPA